MGNWRKTAQEAKINQKVDNYEKDKHLIRLDLISPLVLKEMAKVMGFGAGKHGENDWKENRVTDSKLNASFGRHYLDYRLGNELDRETGIHNLAHAITNLAFRLHYYLEDKEK